MSDTAAYTPPPRLTYLRIRNYRALRDVEFRDLTPLTVLIGANGSGKSTVLDALAFLGECAKGRIQEAWRSRNGLNGIQTELMDGDIQLDLTTRFPEGGLVYQIALTENDGKAVVKRERILDADDPNSMRDDIVGITDILGTTRVAGENLAISMPGTRWFGARKPTPVIETVQGYVPDDSLFLANRYLLGVSSEKELSQLELLNQFVKSYRHTQLVDSHTTGLVDSVETKSLSLTGDNLANVLFYLKRKHPKLLEKIFADLRSRVPRLERVLADETIDKYLVLRLKDEAFPGPILWRFASLGTRRLLAYLVLLNEPEPAGLLGVEEPEAEIHPSLHERLAEDFIEAAARTQIFVSTHSPQFLNALEPEQVWVLDRTPDGYTRATRAADIYGVNLMMRSGAKLGELWLEGRLNPDTRRPPVTE